MADGKPSTLELLKAATSKPAAQPETPATAEAMLEQEVASQTAEQPIEVAEEPPFEIEQSGPVEVTEDAPAQETKDVAEPVKSIKLTASQIDTLTAAQLNKVAFEHNITLDGWPGMKVDEKKAALKPYIDPEYVEKAADTVIVVGGQSLSVPGGGVVVMTPAGADKPVAKIKNTTKITANTDPLIKISFEIENMDESSLQQAMQGWVQRQSLDFFAMGGYLNQMQMNSWFGKYKNLDEFCKNELEISYRTARYMMICYTGILEAGLTASQVQQMGWTKLKDVVPLLTKDNVEDWVQKALTHNVPDFQALVKAEGSPESSGTGPLIDGDKVIKTQSFKLLNDQIDTVKSALEKAKKEGNTENDSVALEYLALSYLNGGGVVQAPTADVTNSEPTVDAIRTWMTEAGAQTVLELVGDVFPDLTMEVSELPTAG